MAKKETKTNAMRMLDEAGIIYQVHVYDTEDGKLDAVTVAEKLNQDPDQVFKTLVTVGNDRNHYVFVVPGNQKLDLIGRNLYDSLWNRYADEFLSG